MGDEIQAIVQKIVMEGRHGPYAVATSISVLGSITFSLTKEVWGEEDRPEPGTFVILNKLRKKRAGWRAMNGRFVRPSDKQ